MDSDWAEDIGPDDEESAGEDSVCFSTKKKNNNNYKSKHFYKHLMFIF